MYKVGRYFIPITLELFSKGFRVDQTSTKYPKIRLATENRLRMCLGPVLAAFKSYVRKRHYQP